MASKETKPYRQLQVDECDRVEYIQIAGIMIKLWRFIVWPLIDKKEMMCGMDSYEHRFCLRKSRI